MLPEATLAQICHVLAQYPVERAQLFGSQARGDARPDSNIDLLVDLHKDARLGLLEIAHLEHELADAKGYALQVTLTPVSQRLWRYIHGDLRPLHEKERQRLPS